MNIKNYFKENSSDIMFGAGLVGMISAGVSAVFATIKYIRESDYKKETEGTAKLPIKTKAKMILKHYSGPIVLAGTASVLLIKSKMEDVKNINALHGALVLTEEAFESYKVSAKEVLGEKQAKKIDYTNEQRKMDATPIPDNVKPEEGKTTLFYEPWSGRWFYSDVNKVKASINAMNDMMLRNDTVTMNDWFVELGLDQTEMGDYFMWDSEHGLLDISFSAHLRNGVEPGITFSYRPSPTYWDK